MMKLFPMVALLFAVSMSPVYAQEVPDQKQEASDPKLVELGDSMDQLIRCQAMLLTEIRLNNIMLVQLESVPNNILPAAINQLKTYYLSGFKENDKMFKLGEFILEDKLVPKAVAIGISKEELQQAKMNMLINMDHKIFGALLPLALDIDELNSAFQVALVQHHAECVKWLGDNSAQ